MVSGVGPAAHLQEVGVPVVLDSPGVGGNLQDHVALGGTAYLVDSPPHTGPMGEVFILPRAATLPTLLSFITGSGGPMYAWPQGEVMGFISTKWVACSAHSGTETGEGDHNSDHVSTSRVVK